LLAIALAVVLSLAGIIRPLNFSALGFDLFFLNNYVPRSGIPIGLWSLAVEEHFYLLFPGMLILLNRSIRPESRVAILLGLCVVVLALRCWEVWRLVDYSQVTFWTHTRIDSILFGAILALWNNPVIDTEDRLPAGLTTSLVGGILLAMTFLIRDEVFRQTLRWSIQGLALILLFNAAIRQRHAMWSILDSRPLRFIAALSYVLYLVHSTLFLAVKHYLGTERPVEAALLTTLASFAVAMLVRRTVELPLGQWRRRVERRWRMEAAVPTPHPHSAHPD
jgi:peptidoglycan/LPS O-acetylase OafA/YrhL